ncbi:hypothetical protein ACIBEA_06680 [Streptomyces sp. NPDC051555]|uniref:hypothetical protein n=1 Tax=Streptomyces sp. NPDC051555 TaxID=3365657 RepID=UPI0037AEE8A6
MADPETDLLIFARTGQALDFSDEDLLTARPARVESRSIAGVSAYFDLLGGQVLDERGDGRLVRLRALVEVGKVDRQRARGMLADSVALKRASQDPISGLGKDEDVIVVALCLLQFSAACRVSTDQVCEAITIHDTDVVSSIAPIRRAHQLLTVLPVRVGHSLACEIAVDEDGDLAREVRLPVRSQLLGDLPAALSDRPFAIYEYFAGEAERLPAKRVNPSIAEFAVHETPFMS